LQQNAGSCKNWLNQFRKLLLYPPELRGHLSYGTKLYFGSQQFQETAGLISVWPVQAWAT
jgi:hypothetical protein